MKFWIKTSLVAALAATTLLSGVAMAGCGHGWGRGGGGYGWRNADPELVKEQMNNRMELHLARLELALALTPEQRPAWADFKKATEARAEVMLKEMESRRNAGLPKTAAERLTRAEEFSKKRANMLADMRKSVEAFYSKLNAAQKTVFDAEAAHFMHPMHGGGCGMGGPGCMAGGGPGYGPGGYEPGYGACMAGDSGVCYGGPGPGHGPGRGAGRGRR